MRAKTRSRVNPASVTLGGVIFVSLLALVLFALTGPSASGRTGAEREPVAAPPRDRPIEPIAMYRPSARTTPEPAPESAREQATVRQTVTVRKGDTLIELLVKRGVERADGLAAIRALAQVFDPRRLQVGQAIALEFAASGRLLSLWLAASVERDVGAVRRHDGGFAADQVEHTFELGAVRAGGVIDDSFYLTAVRAGVPQPIILATIHILSFDVDFQREIQPGDRFEVYFERYFDAEGRAVKDGEVLSTSLIQKGGERAYYRYTPSDDGIPDYFDAEGHSVKKTLMRTPIDGARLTSRFGRRRHPILGYSRMHRGIDFGAPTGTPIMAAGSGRVEAAGWNGSYGRYLRIRHTGAFKTAYAHLSKFARGIRRGGRVKQGQIIGYVGSTGRSTGPHLHYEVHRNGRQINPLSVRLPTGRKLKGKELARFKARLATLQAQLTATPLKTELARGE